MSDKTHKILAAGGAIGVAVATALLAQHVGGGKYDSYYSLALTVLGLLGFTAAKPLFGASNKTTETPK